MISWPSTRPADSGASRCGHRSAKAATWSSSRASTHGSPSSRTAIGSSASSDDRATGCQPCRSAGSVLVRRPVIEFASRRSDLPLRYPSLSSLRSRLRSTPVGSGSRRHPITEAIRGFGRAPDVCHSVTFRGVVVVRAYRVASGDSQQ
ncbi:hypothetical protein FRAHR75_210096 [Frankia sp. Hr75.2]|nr:hypothetical protein FRAHR75_210096 [Frankia sp. Hr75.2]